MDSFLEKQLAAGTAEPGQFTLNEARAQEMLLGSLTLQPESFPKHLLSAAFLGGSERLVACSARGFLAKWASLASGKRRVTFSCSFDGAPLTLEELEHLPESLLHKDRRLQRFAFVFHQLKELSARWFRITSWDVDRIHSLTYKRSRAHCFTRPNPNVRIFRKGILVETYLPSQLIRATRQSLEEGALWSPVECLFDDQALRQTPETEGALHKAEWSIESPAARLIACLDPSQGAVEVYPVVEGLTLPPLAPSDSQLRIPGLRITAHCSELNLDASGLKLVQDEQFRRLCEAASSLASHFVKELAEAPDSSLRHYLLRHWKKFPQLQLAQMPLFQSREGTRHTFQELSQNLHLLPTLEPEDSQFAGRLLGAQHYYRFLRGGESPEQFRTSPNGAWTLALRGNEPLVLDLKNIGNSHQPKRALSSSPDWHPSQPWLVYLAEGGVTVWDAKLQKELTFLPGSYSLVQFSHFGRYLHTFVQDSSHRILYRKLELQEFQTVGHEVELPGFNPKVLDSLLLAWVNPHQFEIRDFYNLSRKLDEFYTEERLDRVLDISPNRRYALLAGPLASYLFDLEQRTLHKLPQALQGGLFSWDSDKVLGLNDRCLLSYDLHSKTLREHRAQGRLAVFRSGLSLKGVRAVSREELKVSWEPLFQPDQHKRGLNHRDTRVSGTYEKFPRWYFLRSRQEPVALWRTGRSKMRVLLSPERTEARLAWEGPEGCYLYRLQGEGPPLTLLPNCCLLGHTLARVQTEKTTLLSAFDGQETLLTSSLTSLASRVDHRATYLNSHRSGDLVVESYTGRPLYHGHQPVAQATENWLSWRGPEGYCFAARESSDTLEGVKLPHSHQLQLHPSEPVALVGSRAYFSLFRLQRMVAHQESALLPGSHARFSPGGTHFFVQGEASVTVYRYPSLERGVRLPLSSSSELQARWLSDQALLIGDQVWWSRGEQDWKSAKPTNWEFPPTLFALPDTSLVVDIGGTEARFFDITTGRLVAFFRPLVEHWFAFTPDGLWEGSPNCCRYLAPKPSSAPSQGLLRKVVAEFSYQF